MEGSNDNNSESKPTKSATAISAIVTRTVKIMTEGTTTKTAPVTTKIITISEQ